MYMIFDESIFITKRRTNDIVTVANGEGPRAHFIGDVRINPRGRMINMKDVSCESKLDANLLSKSALNRSGLAVSFNTILKHSNMTQIHRQGSSPSLTLQARVITSMMK